MLLLVSPNTASNHQCCEELFRRSVPGGRRLQVVGVAVMLINGGLHFCERLVLPTMDRGVAISTPCAIGGALDYATCGGRRCCMRRSTMVLAVVGSATNGMLRAVANGIAIAVANGIAIGYRRCC
jgi:hypothetical protein